MNKFRRNRITNDPYSNRRLRIAVLSVLFALVSTAVILFIIAGTRKDDENVQTFIQDEDLHHGTNPVPHLSVQR